MASSSGNSSGSDPTIQIHNSGSNHDCNRKRKRMESNRESARRSRMRKQKHIDDLINQANKLKSDNAHISTTIDLTTQRFVQIEAENSVLRAQVSELSQRLDSLNEIMNFINTNTNSNCTTINQCNNNGGVNGIGSFEFEFGDNSWNNNMMYFNQPNFIMASDMVGY